MVIRKVGFFERCGIREVRLLERCGLITETWLLEWW